MILHNFPFQMIVKKPLASNVNLKHVFKNALPHAHLRAKVYTYFKGKSQVRWQHQTER